MNNQELLFSMVKTTRMGQTGLRAVLNHALDSDLRAVLHSQLADYDRLEDKAKTLAQKRQWALKQPNSMLQRMIEKMTWMKLSKKNRSSRIADMVIQGNTQGMIHSLRDSHNYKGKDQEVAALNQQLIRCETENIHQMKPFL